MRTTTVVTTAAVALAAGTALAAAPASTGSTPTPGAPVAARAGRTVATVETGNWAGYVQQAPTRQVSARWRVPRVGASVHGSNATWVGIDGLTNRYLAQVGTVEAVEAGRPVTYAWWEVLGPGRELPVQPFALAVHPGDLVRAEVRTAAGRARMTLTNLTTGRSATHVAPYRGPGASADWVQEDVEVDGSISPAVQWSSVTMTGATRNGRPAALRHRDALDIVDGYGVHETHTSRPTRSASSFTVTRLAAGHWTPDR